MDRGTWAILAMIVTMVAGVRVALATVPLPERPPRALGEHEVELVGRMPKAPRWPPAADPGRTCHRPASDLHPIILFDVIQRPPETPRATGCFPGAGGARTETVERGEPIIHGSLDRKRLDAVIEPNMAKIRYCYQRQLTKDPDLAGKITQKFIIARDGTISSASTKSTTMNNPAVEACLNSTFMRLQFPQPKGGGIVVVSYPLLFTPS